MPQDGREHSGCFANMRLDSVGKRYADRRGSDFVEVLVHAFFFRDQGYVGLRSYRAGQGAQVADRVHEAQQNQSIAMYHHPVEIGPPYRVWKRE